MPAVVVDSPDRARTIPGVPDLPLHFGNTDSGRTLPSMARSYLEPVFGLDLSGVRVHIGELPAQLGARAFAHGTDLYFLPEVYDPASAAGLGEIAHELVHVCQQQRGRTARSGGPLQLVRDAAQEAQAERVARLVSRNDPRARRVIGGLFGGLDRLSPARARWDTIQPNIKVLIDGQYVHITDTDDALRKIPQGCKDQEIKENFNRIKLRIRPVLHKWIHASTKKWKRFVMGQDEHTVRYESWEGLARALLGEVRSEGNQEQEEILAKATVKSGYVNTQLADYITFVNSRLGAYDYRKAWTKIQQYDPYKGEYSFYYPFDGFKKVLANPGKYTLEHKVAVIHDLVKPFEQVDPDFCEVPEKRCKVWALVPNGVRGYNIKDMDMDDFRTGKLTGTHCSLKEESEIVQTFREQNSPMGFGPSFTTGRCAQCCYRLSKEMKSEGVTAGWINAIAWGLFAFWNLYYKKQWSRAHTFHEIMGMAHNYGIPYLPFTYPRTCPSTEDPYPTGDIL